MRPLVTTETMARADRAAIEQLRTSEERLMELAGREASRIIRDAGESFLIICGRGNNGGDGFVLARHLLNSGASVILWHLSAIKELKPVNRAGFDILISYQPHCPELQIAGSLEETKALLETTPCDVIVDAVLGTGLSIPEDAAPLKESAAEAVDFINELHDTTPAVTVAIDIPSGLDATSGFCASPTVRADLTVTMAFEKTGFYFNHGPALAGEVETVEISIPSFLLPEPRYSLVDSAFAAECYTLRDTSSAKHQNGKLLIVAGSRTPSSSMLGAAILASKGAAACGTGYLSVSLPTELTDPLHVAIPSATLIGRTFDAIMEKAAWADAVVLGCGMGRDHETRQLLLKLLREPLFKQKKLVLDADALFHLAETGLSLRELGLEDTLLTPHLGEFSRLQGDNVENIQRNLVGSATDFSSTYGVNLLLKGSPTIISSPEGELLISTSGTEALASAGSGDVLAGMIGALAAKGESTLNAGAAAAWIHGRAGDLAAPISSQVTADMLPGAVKEAIEELFDITPESPAP